MQAQARRTILNAKKTRPSPSLGNEAVLTPEMHPSIHIETHDAALVASIRYTLSGNSDEAFSKLENTLLNIARKVGENYGIIGHIKAYAHDNGKSCVLSVTDAESPPQITVFESEIVIAEITVIVLMLNVPVLESILKEIFSTDFIY